MSKNTELYNYIEIQLETKPQFKLICDKLSKYSKDKVQEKFNVRVVEERVSKNDVGVYKIQKLKQKKNE